MHGRDDKQIQLQELLGDMNEKPYKEIPGVDVTVDEKVADVAIGFSKIVGRKSPATQENEITTGINISDFQKLSHPERVEAMLETFAELQKKSAHFDDGACACVTISWLEDFPNSKDKKLVTYTANAGKCSTFYLKANEKNKVVGEAEQLNTFSDRPEDAPDLKWQKDQSGTPRLGLQVGGVVASRALGDAKYEKFGLIHVPHIATREFRVGPKETPYLVVASDGLTEIVDQMKTAKIRQWMQKIKQLGLPIILKSQNEKLEIRDPATLTDAAFIQLAMQVSLPAPEAESKSSLGNIAEKLTRWGYQFSANNISNVVIVPGKTPSFGAVFDGHGGNKVALHASQNFQPILRRIIQTKLAQKISEGAAPPVTFFILSENKKPAVPIIIPPVIVPSGIYENTLKLFKSAIENSENIAWWKKQVFFGDKITTGAGDNFRVSKTTYLIKQEYDLFFNAAEKYPASREEAAKEFVDKISDIIDASLARYQSELSHKNKIKPLRFFYLGMRALIDVPQQFDAIKHHTNQLPILTNLGERYLASYSDEHALKSSTKGSEFKRLP